MRPKKCSVIPISDRDVTGSGWAVFKIDTTAPVAAIVRDLRDFLALMRAVDREARTAAPRRPRGRPVEMGDRVYRDVLRREVNGVHAELHADRAAIRKARMADRPEIIARAISRFWPGRRVSEIALEIAKERSSPRQAAVRFVARMRGLTPRAVDAAVRQKRDGK